MKIVFVQKLAFRKSFCSFHMSEPFLKLLTGSATSADEGESSAQSGWFGPEISRLCFDVQVGSITLFPPYLPFFPFLARNHDLRWELLDCSSERKLLLFSALSNHLSALKKQWQHLPLSTSTEFTFQYPPIYKIAVWQWWKFQRVSKLSLPFCRVLGERPWPTRITGWVRPTLLKSWCPPVSPMHAWKKLRSSGRHDEYRQSYGGTLPTELCWPDAHR